MGQGGSLSTQLSKKVGASALQLWELICIVVALFIVAILLLLWVCFFARRRARNTLPNQLRHIQIPPVSKDIKEVSNREPEKVVVHGGGETSSQSGSFHHVEKDGSSHSEGDSSGTVGVNKPSASHYLAAPSPLSGLPEFCHLGWGHWFTLRDLELATNQFSKENILGEGGYGVVYRGRLINGAPVAIKKLLNNL